MAKMLLLQAMQRVGGKIFLTVGDDVMRSVFSQSLTVRFPGAVELCSDGKAIWRSESSYAVLADGRAGISLRLGGTGRDETVFDFPMPIRLGDVLYRIARYFTLGAMQGVSIGPWTLYPAENRLELKRGGGENIRLTEKESGILLLLHGKKGGVADRQELLDTLWGYADGVETHTLETHIYRLRQKIELDPAKPCFLLTDGSGYRLAK